MAFVERATALRDRLPRALRRAQDGGVMQTEQQASPAFSSEFLHQLDVQRKRDIRLAGLIPTAPLNPLPSGQDHVINVMLTENGKYVVKTLKPTSRAHLAFGLGIPPSEIPPDGDTTRARARLVSEQSGVVVDPHAVADKVRLLHVMAATYLDGGTGAIWPTATVVNDGEVHEIQRYLPPQDLSFPLYRDPREVAIEHIEKAKLFGTLQQRWAAMLQTPDFQQLPPDVQAYWRTFPPDATATNAHFLGIGDVVAIDY